MPSQHNDLEDTRPIDEQIKYDILEAIGNYDATYFGYTFDGNGMWRAIEYDDDGNEIARYDLKLTIEKVEG